MIYKYITNQKFSKLFKLISCILICSFTITVSGCYTAGSGYVYKDELKYNTTFNILSVQLKNGLVINLKDKLARYLSEYEGQKEVIVYAESGIRKISENVYNTTKTEIKVIELKDVFQVTVEKEEFNAAGTILTVLGILAGILIIVAAIYAATKQSCPFVYSFDGLKYTFDAEPYGGAITNSLTRTDYSRLEYLKPFEGEYKLLMRNEADETQHTDEMKLWVIDHSPVFEVTPDASGNLTCYSKIIPPVYAKDENGIDLIPFIQNKDNNKWQTNLPTDTSLTGKNLRHELIFKFPKPRNANSARFFANAGTALWGGYMIKGMLNLRGDKVDDWYKSINEKGTEFTELYKFMEREELYSLKINMLEDGKWVKKGYLTAGGPFIYEDRTAELDLKNCNDDTITIKLNPPYGFWEIDQIGIIYDYKELPEVKELPVKFAKDEKGNELTYALSHIDRNYYDMTDSNSKAEVFFNVPAQKEGTKRTLYLKTTGYYDIHLKKDKPEQKEFIEQIYSTPGLITEYAMKEYVRKINALHATGKFDDFRK